MCLNWTRIGIPGAIYLIGETYVKKEDLRVPVPALVKAYRRMMEAGLASQKGD
jgi:hypothetical protein